MKVRPTGLCEKQLKPIQLLELVRNFPESNFVLENTGGKTLMVISASFTQKQIPGPWAKSEILVSHMVKNTQVQNITFFNAGKCWNTEE